MRTYRCKGTITVFLSLISVLFLSLLCTVMESARMQGTRAKAAAALDMGMFSLFGEFENSVLEKYDVFFLDGASGEGRYNTENLESRLEEYMKYNVSPDEGILFRSYDPFKLTMNSAKITGTAFATDEKGAAFYQQAVGFMYDNLATEVLDRWMAHQTEAEQLEQAADLYENRESSVQNEMEVLEEQQRQIEEEQRRAQEEAKETGLVPVEETPREVVPDSENPLEVIRKIRRKGILGLVLGDKAGQISEKKISSDIPSRRPNQKGSLLVQKKYGGISADFLFAQYLFERCSLYTDPKKQEEMPLDYELEYILCGKNSDEKNLKKVINRLLLMREGANFLFLNQSPSKRAEAEAFAALLVGAVPVAGLVPVVSYALMLVWAYAESILDLRCLFEGGKVPVIKTEADWRLDLKSIPKLLEILDNIQPEKTSGIGYEGYLQILFTLGSNGKYPMRALDLLEGYVRKNTQNQSFRADHAIVKAQFCAEYQIPSVFLNVTDAFMKTGITSQEYRANGTFAY